MTFKNKETELLKETISNQREEIKRWKDLYESLKDAPLLKARVEELEKELAHTRAELRMEAMTANQMLAMQAARFEAEAKQMVEQVNAELARRDAQASAVSGEVAK